jgi:putative ABC transport system permease protein
VRVVGILTSQGGGIDYQMCMPIKAAVNVIKDAKKNVYNSIQIEARSPDVVDTVDKAIVNKLLISRHDNTVGDQDFTVFNTASIASTVTSTIASMSLFLVASLE